MNNNIFSNFIKTDNNKLSIDITDIDVSILNSIRRTIFTHIPNVGFYFKLDDHYIDSNMNIISNDSPIHNEFLAHRISLIPICVTANMIENRELDKYKFIIIF